MTVRNHRGSWRGILLALLPLVLVAGSLCLAMLPAVAMASEAGGGCGSPMNTPSELSCCAQELEPASAPSADALVLLAPSTAQAPTVAVAPLPIVASATPGGPPAPIPLRL